MSTATEQQQQEQEPQSSTSAPPSSSAPSSGSGQQNVKEFLALERFAVVGASADAQKWGHKVLSKFLESSKDVTPVNPNREEVLEIETVASVNELGDDLSRVGISIVTQPDVTRQILDDVARAKGRFVWCQPGAEFEGIKDRARELNIDIIFGGPDVMEELEKSEGQGASAMGSSSSSVTAPKAGQEAAPTSGKSSPRGSPRRASHVHKASDAAGDLATPQNVPSAYKATVSERPHKHQSHEKQQQKVHEHGERVVEAEGGVEQGRSHDASESAQTTQSQLGGNMSEPQPLEGKHRGGRSGEHVAGAEAQMEGRGPEPRQTSHNEQQQRTTTEEEDAGLREESQLLGARDDDVDEQQRGGSSTSAWRSSQQSQTHSRSLHQQGDQGEGAREETESQSQTQRTSQSQHEQGLASGGSLGGGGLGRQSQTQSSDAGEQQRSEQAQTSAGKAPPRESGEESGAGTRGERFAQTQHTQPMRGA